MAKKIEDTLQEHEDAFLDMAKGLSREKNRGNLLEFLTNYQKTAESIGVSMMGLAFYLTAFMESYYN